MFVLIGSTCSTWCGMGFGAGRNMRRLSRFNAVPGMFSSRGVESVTGGSQRVNLEDGTSCMPPHLGVVCTTLIHSRRFPPASTEVHLHHRGCDEGAGEHRKHYSLTGMSQPSTNTLGQMMNIISFIKNANQAGAVRWIRAPRKTLALVYMAGHESAAHPLSTFRETLGIIPAEVYKPQTTRV